MPGSIPKISLSIFFGGWLCLAAITTITFAQQATDQAEVRAFVQHYFESHAKNDLVGVLRRWSEKSPAYATNRETLEKRFAAQTTAIKIVEVSRLKIEGGRATLRATLDVAVMSKPDGQARQERQTNNLQLIRAAGGWKIWDITPAVNDLAVALERAKTEQEQEQLLAQEKDLIDISLLAALKELAGRHTQKGDHAQALSLSQLAARIAERIGDRRAVGNALSDLGAIYARQKRAAQALDYLQKSLVISEETGDKQGMARALYNIGIAYESQNQLEQALEYYRRGLAVSAECGDKSLTASILHRIGFNHKSQGRFELALEFYRKSRALIEELNDKGVLKELLINIGNVLLSQGQSELALESFQSSRAICEELGDKAALERVLNNLGLVYIGQGRYLQALECLHKAVKIGEGLSNDDAKLSRAIRLNNIGLVYRRQGRYEQALEYHRRSLKLLEELNDKARIGQAQNNIGVVYKSQGQYEQALEWLQKSLKCFEALNDKGDAAMSLNNIGDAYRRQGRYELAREHLQKSLRLREENNHRLGITRSLNNLSLLYRDQGQYAETLEVSRRAARLAEEINAPEELWVAQESMGRAFRALGQIEQARQSSLAAIATIEALRHQVAGGGQQQQSFLENRLSPWLGMIDLLVSQNESAEALTFAERAKARVLLDVLQTGRTNIQRSLSAQERQEEEQQRQRLSSLNSQLTREALSAKPDPARIAELKSQLAKARLDVEALEMRLYIAHPELKINRGELKPIAVNEMAPLLNEQTALLEFAVSEEKTHLFVITKTKAATELKTYRLPFKRQVLADRTEQFRKYLAEKDLRYSPPARELYDILLKPAAAQLQGKTRLVIVPDGPLWELPFQALMRGDNRFLIEECAISTAPSLTFLREMIRLRGRRNKTSQPAALLAVGNPALGNEMLAERAELMGDKLEPLPFAEQQAVQLGQLYKDKAKVLIGAAATEERIKAEVGKYRILHLATHGVLDDRNPMYSHLVFAQNGTNVKVDGLLEAREILELDLNADLAVLSACETGRGRISAGEGLIGLTWALFVAGVPSTVVSQWKVADKSTAQLMMGFHKQLQAQNGKGEKTPTYAEALRLAALSLMKQNAYRHPFHWAGFVLVGDGF